MGGGGSGGGGGGGGSRSGAVPEGLACATKDSTQLRLVPLTSISALTDCTPTHTHTHCTHPHCSDALIVTASLADKQPRSRRQEAAEAETCCPLHLHPHVGKQRAMKEVGKCVCRCWCVCACVCVCVGRYHSLAGGDRLVGD